MMIRSEIGASKDLNNYKTQGRYIIGEGVSGIANTPSTNTSFRFVEVFDYAYGAAVQILKEAYPAKNYWRTYNPFSKSWSVWSL